MTTRSIEDLGLRLVPIVPVRRRSQHSPKLTLRRDRKSTSLTLSPAARALLRNPAQVQVLIGGTTLAVRASEPGVPQSRRVTTSHGVSARELTTLFGLEIGDRYRMPCELVDGHLVVELPGELIARTRERTSKDETR